MASATEPEIHQEIMREYLVDTRSVEIRTVKDQVEALRYDVTRIRTFPLLARGVIVAGGIYDVHSGKLPGINTEPWAAGAKKKPLYTSTA